MLNATKEAPGGTPKLGSIVQVIARGDIFVTEPEGKHLREVLEGLAGTPPAYKAVLT
eukprot:CAMPEP_0118949272 /NCGR_PEP_ID=MMETSP1169-20130426/49348_1 /TAXON_ID=36882 /ORGANISM="Pyramimonas obovata, Strain CCMP722" /LENGTH=56 /DNA_ID=CAMNT_0006895873 /DNA_START=30 /DNA_END=196 /DNA_ORIENTATION=-